MQLIQILGKKEIELLHGSSGFFDPQRGIEFGRKFVRWRCLIKNVYI